MIQDSSPRVLGNLGSWIRHIETQCGSIFQCGPPRGHVEILGRIGFQCGRFVRTLGDDLRHVSGWRGLCGRRGEGWS